MLFRLPISLFLYVYNAAQKRQLSLLNNFVKNQAISIFFRK